MREKSKTTERRQERILSLLSFERLVAGLICTSLSGQTCQPLIQGYPADSRRATLVAPIKVPNRGGIQLKLSTRSRSSICAIALVLLCTHVVAGQGEWVLEKDEAGVRVYTRSVPGWSVRQFRGVVEIEARVESLLALLDDNASCPRWIHNCILSELLEQSDLYRKHSYMQTKAPWPVKKRDTILLTTTTITDGHVEITGTAKPDYRPQDRKFVRIPKQEIRWELTPLGNGYVQVVFETKFDPGGSVPDWALNRTLIDTPFNTLTQMRLVVQEPIYRNTE